MASGRLWCASWPRRYVPHSNEASLIFLTNKQGVNVFIAALDDGLLRTTQSELSQEFPNLRIEAVPVNLGGNPDDYMRAVAAATENIPVAIVINNAGFLKMDYFDNTDIALHAANIECNSIAAIRLTHYFYRRMVDQNIKGCIAFTSSAVFFMVRLQDSQLNPGRWVF